LRSSCSPAAVTGVRHCNNQLRYMTCAAASLHAQAPTSRIFGCAVHTIQQVHHSIEARRLVSRIQLQANRCLLQALMRGTTPRHMHTWRQLCSPLQASRCGDVSCHHHLHCRTCTQWTQKPKKDGQLAGQLIMVYLAPLK
jgi:hypothetical protein